MSPKIFCSAKIQSMLLHKVGDGRDHEADPDLALLIEMDTS
jgi:hypothetical protein